MNVTGTEAPGSFRLRVVPLSPSFVTQKKFFLAIFFCVTHDGLSERGTTRSLGSLGSVNIIKGHCVTAFQGDFSEF